MIRLSANLGFLWPDRPLLERIAAAGRAGFGAVELHWPFGTDPRLVAEACAAAGVKLLAVNTPVGDASRGELGLGAVPGREADFLALAREAVDWCAAAGGVAVHAMAGVTSETEEARATFVANLRQAAALAEARGLALLIEPINRADKPGYFLSRVSQAAAIVDAVGASNLRIMFDAYHVAREEGDVLDRLHRVLPLVGHVQIAAVPSRAEPDEGELGYRGFLQAVGASGYRGWVGCEYRPRGDTDAGLAWRGAFLSAPSSRAADPCPAPP